MMLSVMTSICPTRFRALARSRAAAAGRSRGRAPRGTGARRRTRRRMGWRGWSPQDRRLLRSTMGRGADEAGGRPGLARFPCRASSVTVGGVGLSTCRSKSAAGTAATRSACLAWCGEKPAVGGSLGAGKHRARCPPRFRASRAPCRRLDLPQQLARPPDGARPDPLRHGLEPLVVDLLGIGRQRRRTVDPVPALVKPIAPGQLLAVRLVVIAQPHCRVAGNGMVAVVTVSLLLAW